MDDTRKMENHLHRLLFADAEWFRMAKSFLHVLTWDEAVFLSFLLNHSYRTKSRRRGGWFYCTIKFVEKEIHANKDKQFRLLRSLREKELISIRRKCIPGRRWIRVNIGYVLKMVESHFSAQDEWF